jgi:glycine/D-amino acid oxidase-like deaminating enzyme
MEEPPSAPLTLDDRSYWLREALRGEPDLPSPSLVGSARADVCVVGGGFEGLWTAYELTEAEPSMDVVILEADVCGAGGSGANGGFFSASWDELEKLTRLFGRDEGIRYAGAIADQWPEVKQWCVRHDADISGHRDGCIFVRAGKWQEPANPEVLSQLEAAGYADRLSR